MEKILFKGTFNWYGEIHTLYRHAHSLAQALQLMLRALAKTLDNNSVPCYFNGRRDNFKLEVENG